jgi:hypothetical protein
MLPTIRFFFILLLFTLLAGFFFMPAREMPDHALVMLDDRNRTYLSPACAGKEKKEYRAARAAEAYRLKYAPDKKCLEGGGFSQHGRSITGNWLEKLGLLPPYPSRWNADGTWNW